MNIPNRLATECTQKQEHNGRLLDITIKVSVKCKHNRPDIVFGAD